MEEDVRGGKPGRGDDGKMSRACGGMCHCGRDEARSTQSGWRGGHDKEKWAMIRVWDRRMETESKEEKRREREGRRLSKRERAGEKDRPWRRRMGLPCCMQAKSAAVGSTVERSW
eukprot:5123675-Pleurochrysis_carterae.AAC.1